MYSCAGWAKVTGKRSFNTRLFEAYGQTLQPNRTPPRPAPQAVHTLSAVGETDSALTLLGECEGPGSLSSPFMP